jgi:copper chaperone CopZ
MRQTVIEINGMHCGGCVAAVKRALDRAGVEKSDIVVGAATVFYDETNLELKQLFEAVEKAGFSPVDPEATSPNRANS